MAQIYNSDLSKELIDGARIQVSSDYIPNQIADKVVPVMEVNPKLLRTSYPFTLLSSLANATSVTIYTCSTTKDTYITGATLSMIKDVTATSTGVSLNVMDDLTGLTNPIINIAGITLTANAQSESITISPPIKLRKGSNVTITSTTNVANVVAKAALIGFEVYNPLA
jgi:hypothetical protein